MTFNIRDENLTVFGDFDFVIKKKNLFHRSWHILYNGKDVYTVSKPWKSPCCHRLYQHRGSENPHKPLPLTSKWVYRWCYRVPACPLGSRTARRLQVEPRGRGQLTRTGRRTQTLKAKKQERCQDLLFEIVICPRWHQDTFVTMLQRNAPGLLVFCYLWSWECAGNPLPVWHPLPSSWHKGWPPPGTCWCFSCI